MESRNITLTLDKAKEWYNSGSSDLREVALQAYTEKELTGLEFTNIKTFEDACEALNLNIGIIKVDINNIKRLRLEANTTDHLIAIYKLDIIRKALNKDWKPSLIKDNVYYPYIRIYLAGDSANTAAINNGWEVKETFKVNDKKYTLVGGDYSSYFNNGLTVFNYRSGVVIPNLGLFGCKSKEIAEHMSCYFSKEIFEATYAQHIGIYEWV